VGFSCFSGAEKVLNFDSVILVETLGYVSESHFCKMQKFEPSFTISLFLWDLYFFIEFCGICYCAIITFSFHFEFTFAKLLGKTANLL